MQHAFKYAKFEVPLDKLHVTSEMIETYHLTGANTHRPSQPITWCMLTKLDVSLTTIKNNTQI